LDTGSDCLALVTESVATVAQPREIVHLVVERVAVDVVHFEENIIARTVLALVARPIEPTPKAISCNVTSPLQGAVTLVD
jgi:hypothetical protein